MITPAQSIKDWDSKFYYELLAWKDRNPKKFQQLSASDSLNGCTEAEIAAMTIVLLHEVIERHAHVNPIKT